MAGCQDEITPREKTKERKNAMRNNEDEIMPGEKTKNKFKMALFRKVFFLLFALIFRHFAWRISLFLFFFFFVFSLSVISSWRRAITPINVEKTKWHKQATI